jgi:hypothetical protein
MNTLIVILSESVIWYEYGMHRRSAIPSTVEAEPYPGPGPSSRSDDSGEDPDDPFITGLRERGKNSDVRGRESVSQGFWMIKRKEWKTCYNPTGESGLEYASSYQRQRETDDDIPFVV